MVWAIVSRPAEARKNAAAEDTLDSSPASEAAASSDQTRRKPRVRAYQPRLLVRRRVSPLTARILAVNALALAILAVGLLYLDRYQEGLIDTEVQALTVQAQLIAGALGEGATDLTDVDVPELVPPIARALVRRLAAPTHARAQLFGASGEPIVDSSLVLRPGGIVTVLPLPDTRPPGALHSIASDAYDWIFNSLPRRDNFPPYRAGLPVSVAAYPEGMRALQGEPSHGVYLAPDGHLVFNVAIPVQRYREVLGVIMLSRTSADIDASLRKVRLDILLVFLVALAVTVMLSLYLSGTIARPVRRLAAAAERVRLGRATADTIPDFSSRNDEIGDLSVAFRAMTETLHQKLRAIERFAADVAHEIKNPLTSLRSAVETAARLNDPEKQRRLLDIVGADVRRLDRLISDISNASRVDAEMLRAEPTEVDLGRMIRALAEIHGTNDGPDAQKFDVRLDPAADLRVLGIEDRLIQILQNLIGNAVSFSPPGGTVTLAAVRLGPFVRVIVEDQGPGIPEGKAEKIFDRFYSERPAGEAFGMHSGLGLSISRQIAEAHNGSLRATNRTAPDGAVLGAAFILQLPAAHRSDRLDKPAGTPDAAADDGTPVPPKPAARRSRKAAPSS